MTGSRLAPFGFPEYALTFTTSGNQAAGTDIYGNPIYVETSYSYIIYLVRDTDPTRIRQAGLDEANIPLKGRVRKNLNEGMSELALHEDIGMFATAPMEYLGSRGEFVLDGKTTNQTLRIRPLVGQRVLGFWRARG